MKILLLKNNITDPATLANGIIAVKNYASTIGLTLDFTEVETTKQFTSVSFSNAPNTEGYVSGVEITPQEVFDEAKRLGYVFSPENIVCIVFDSSKIIPPPTNPIDNGVVIQIPCNWYATFPDVFALYFLHELCHYSASLNNIPDLTHNFYSSPFAQVPGGTIPYYLSLLKPFVKPSQAPITPVVEFKPDVVITRLWDNSFEIFGQLRTVDGKFGCDSLERSWKNNQVNISAIPTGNYVCKWSFMWRQLRYRYQLQNVKGRSGIFFHSGNYYFDSAGCIILGSMPQDINHDGQTDLVNSGLITTAFENYMKKLPFNLQIK